MTMIQTMQCRPPEAYQLSDIHAEIDPSRGIEVSDASLEHYEDYEYPS